MNSADQPSIFPLSFSVNVAGIMQQATVLADCSDVESYKYRVRFEDNFEDIFTVVEWPDLCIQSSEGGSDHYSNALLNDLYELTKIEQGVFFYVMPMTFEGEQLNVWLMEEEPFSGDKQCISVSYDRKLQFELYLSDLQENWQYRELTRPLSESEKQMAAELAATMQSIHLALQF